jgi:hypothetical protein
VFVVLLGGMLCLFRGLGIRHPLSLVEWLLPFVGIYFHLALAPIPWQWAQDGPRRVATIRGLIVSLAFNATWIGGLRLRRPDGLPMHRFPQWGQAWRTRSSVSA